jgi:membrane-associated phospholipid phosphatase
VVGDLWRATLGLIAADGHIMRQVPQSGDTLAAGRWGSRPGAPYTLLPLSAGFYLLGSGTHRPRLRETGLLGMEALAGSTIVGAVVKAATIRERPLEGNGEGRFWQGSGRLWNGGSSFPSGHAIDSWALAWVVAHEYPCPRIVVGVAAYP